MNELQRQSYLQTMGVDIIVPRFILPAAKMTERCELPQVEEVLPAASAANLAQTNGLSLSSEPALGSVQAIVPELASGLVKELKPELAAQMPGQSQHKSPAEKNAFTPTITDDSIIEDVRTPTRVTSEKAPQFQLLFAYYGSELVFALPSPSGQLSVDQQRLLYDIAFSMTITPSVQGGQWRYELFRWPLQKGKQLEQGEDAARQTLQGFVQRFAGSTLIIMGQLAGHFLCPDSTAGSDDSVALKKPNQLYFPHDLNELMTRPALKKPLWQQLQLLQLQMRKSHH